MTADLSNLFRQEPTGEIQYGGARMVLMDIEAGFWDIRHQMEALIGSRMTSSVLQQAGMNSGSSFARSFVSRDSENVPVAFQACLQAYQLAGFGQFEMKTMQWPLGKIVVEASETFESWMTAQHKQQVDVPICAYTAGVLAGFINAISNRQDVVCVEHHCRALNAEKCTFELLPADKAGDQAVISSVSDSMLGRQLNLLDILFDRMPMGIAIYDREYRLVRFNLTWVTLNQKYTMARPDQIVPGAHIFDIQPGTEDVVIPKFERVFQGETIQEDSARIVSRGIESFWDVVLTPLYDGDQVVGLMNVSTDATERMMVLRNLEGRVQERTEEIERRRKAVEGLWETLRVINSSASLDETLDFIVAQADALNEARFVSLSMLKGPQGPIQIHAMRGEFPEEMLEVTMDIGEGTVGRAIKERRTIAISNVSEVVQAPSPDAIDESHQIFISERSQAVLDLAAEHFQAVLAIPLMTSRQIYGALVYYYPEPREFSEQEIELASSFAEQAALAIENARLHEAEAARQRELKLLLDLSAAANNPLDLDEMLESTMDRLIKLVGASRVGLMLSDRETGELASYMIRPQRDVSQADMDKMLQACAMVAANGKPLFLAPDPDQGLMEPGALLPLISHSQTLGVMGIIGAAGTRFSDSQLSLFQTIADQFSTALESARLFHETNRRRHVAEGLQDILGVLNNAESLEVTLNFIIQKALELTSADAGVIYHYDADQSLLLIEAGANLPLEFETIESVPLYQGGAFQAMFDRDPYVLQQIGEHLKDVLQTPQADALNQEMRFWLETIYKNYASYLGIPLIIQGQIYGSLGLYFAQPHQFLQEEIELAVAFGDQTALCIENAQLSVEVSRTAVQDERNRLARDLHDAVTQTLFSASLVAEVLPKLWEMNQEMGQQKLDELRKLTRGALSEMRTLLMELRPSALVDADIEDLFQHLINAFTARSMVAVQFIKEGDEDPPVPVKEVFYRVVQEALNNVAKHAGAQNVEITLSRQPEVFSLTIRDDGCGFDPAAVTQDHLGLGIMEERVRSIGAVLKVDSTPSVGTEIFLRWNANTEEKNDR